MRGGQRDGTGRPPEPDPRDCLIQVRVTGEELERVKATAAHYKMSVSELVRRALGLASMLLVLIHGCDNQPMESSIRGCSNGAEVFYPRGGEMKMICPTHP